LGQLPPGRLELFGQRDHLPFIDSQVFKHDSPTQRRKGMGRSVGKAEELERRRRLAVARVEQGYSQAEVARFLGVQPNTVWQWVQTYRRGGVEALSAKPHPGRPPRLTEEREQQVLSWIRHNPTEFGFATELWTAPRVAQVIQQRFGVSFHPRYLNQWLTEHGIRPQKPERQPRERDEQAIQRWLAQDWPRLEKKDVRKRRI
jgi:transposase